MSQTLEQKRAKYALEEILKINNETNESFKKKYAPFVRRTPTRILNNGLGQALAFLLSKANKEKAAKRFYDQLQSWICGVEDDSYPMRIYIDNSPNLIQQLMANGRREYVLAQTEVLALLDWMKKFADAYLPENTGGEG